MRTSIARKDAPDDNRVAGTGYDQRLQDGDSPAPDRRTSIGFSPGRGLRSLERRLGAGVLGWTGRKAATSSIEACVFSLLVGGLAGPSLGTLIGAFLSAVLVSTASVLGIERQLRFKVRSVRATLARRRLEEAGMPRPTPRSGMPQEGQGA
jgi:hypothetical protein